MSIKFRSKNYYKIIITILICLLLGFLYLGNYNLIENYQDPNEALAIAIDSKEVKDSKGVKDSKEVKDVKNTKDAKHNKEYSRFNDDQTANGGYNEDEISSRALLSSQQLKNVIAGKNSKNLQ